MSMTVSNVVYVVWAIPVFFFLGMLALEIGEAFVALVLWALAPGIGWAIGGLDGRLIGAEVALAALALAALGLLVWSLFSGGLGRTAIRSMYVVVPALIGGAAVLLYVALDDPEASFTSGESLLFLCCLGVIVVTAGLFFLVPKRVHRQAWGSPVDPAEANPTPARQHRSKKKRKRR